eukprot:scaffold28679_cov69-Phaeocystis_antarctica.AAC.1
MPNNVYIWPLRKQRETLSHSDVHCLSAAPPHCALRKCVAAFSTESNARILPLPPVILPPSSLTSLLTWLGSGVRVQGQGSESGSWLGSGSGVGVG